MCSSCIAGYCTVHGWAATPGRIWLVPTPMTITLDNWDAPIFDRLYWESFPIRWITGTWTEGGDA